MDPEDPLSTIVTGADPLPQTIGRGGENIEDDNNIAIYDIQDEEFNILLNSPEWTEEVEE